MSASKLKDLPVGSVVKIKVSDTLQNFIVARIATTSTISGIFTDTSKSHAKLILQKAWGSAVTWSNVSGVLTNFYNAIDSAIQPYMHSNTSGDTEGYAFLPDEDAVNGGWEYFSSNANRECKSSSGSSVTWWTSSADSSNSSFRIYVSAGGTVFSQSRDGVTASQAAKGVKYVRPAICLNGDLMVSSDGTVTSSKNVAPTTPSSINIPSTIMGGSTITVSWGTSTDSNGNFAGYKVERSTDGGSTWSQIYQGTVTSTTNAVAFGTSSVMYRVKAYDTYNAESSYKTSSAVTVINNYAPSAPSSITVPDTVRGGNTITVSWGAATDNNGDTITYTLERNVNSGGWSQLYKGTNRSYSDSITKGWSTVAYRVKATDTYSASSSYTTSATRTVINNTAPTTPSSISVPSKIMGGSTITISWSASSDTENNLEGYKLERSTDGGSTWSQVYQGQSNATTNTVAFGTSSVMYRVKAYDSEGLESGYRTSSQVSIINNHAPEAPAAISVPSLVIGGETLTITWSESTDEDGDKVSYELERSANSGDWKQLYSGGTRSYSDTVTKGWNTVQYRVRAYDTYGAYSSYTTGEARTVINNTAPAITCTAGSSGVNLGQKNEPFSLSYSVFDADADSMTVTEMLDGVVVRTRTSVTNDNSLSFDAASDSTEFMKILNGTHTIKITASDGKMESTFTATFSKNVTSCSITLKEPIEPSGSDDIAVAVLHVVGSIPDDATMKVEVTNNANDSSPVWQDCTSEVEKESNIVFTNAVATNGWAFNFKISVSEGASGEGGYIQSVFGAFNPSESSAS